MTEPEEKDRWSALAEELGLPPQAAETPPPLRTAPQAHESAIPEPLEPSEPPAAAEERPARGRRHRSLPVGEATTDEPVETLPSEEASETVETPAGEERPRRRRRARGSKKTRNTPASETTADAAEAETGAEEKPRRRRRRRSKKADKEAEAPSAEREEAKVEEAPAEEPAPGSEDDEESEDFSTWNVPSWAEIISGLYRPEH